MMTRVNGVATAPPFLTMHSSFIMLVVSLSLSMLILLSADVYYLGIFKHYIEEEAGEHVLRDLNFQLGHLLDVFGLLYFVLSVADKSALHHGDYPDVLFDIVDC